MWNETSTTEAVARTDRAVVLGLGNPGAGYQHTRHNLGFRVIDSLHRGWSAEPWREECAALCARAEAAELVKPQTFMNRSGHAVRCLVERYGYQPERILVVYDDIALPLGTLRLRPVGGPGGHRGLASVVGSLRTDSLPRLRLGIAPPGEAPSGDLAEFVLRGFDPEEIPLVERQIERAVRACEAWLERGVEPAMAAFNGPLPPIDGVERAAAQAGHEEDTDPGSQHPR
ncbi:MAG TPA: aminoacyl-tRNA hydrolase [Thermoanaerobaculia bacterium]|nr:aminoacyl-tRNA hydrolase [Thermoanaerobaculia bacterium]